MLNPKNILSIEDIAVQKATSRGHLDPRKCPKHKSCLDAEDVNQQKANRTIIDFRMIPVEKIIPNNIRLNDVDTSYCREELLPLMKKKLEDFPNSFGLDYPLFVTEHGTDFENVSGHNRFWVMENLLKYKEVPAFVISNVGTPIQKLIGKIVPNSRQKNSTRQYTMDDVIEQMKMFRQNNYFSNISDVKTTKDEFELLMDKIHPYQFIDKVPRGKIFKGFYNNKTAVAKTKIPYSRKERNAALSRNGYPTMVDKSGKDINFLFCHCPERKILFFSMEYNDVNYESQLFKFVTKVQTDPEYKKEFSGYDIHLVPFLRGVPNSIPQLNDRRRKFATKAQGWNKVLNLVDHQVTQIVFPKQLSSEKKDVLFTLDIDTKQFSINKK